MSIASETPQSRCRFGIAAADITPPVGMYHRMWGAASHDRSTGIHRPLRATALALGPRDGTELRLLIALDHCLLGRDELDRILHGIDDQAGIPPDAVFVTCSHTHAAGLLSLDRVDLPGGDLIPAYLDRLAETCGEIARQAVAAMEPAAIVYGFDFCQFAKHRDFFDPHAEQYVCGYNPLDPADMTLTVARATSDDGRTLASIVNYACHPTTLAWDNTLVSPDYPGAMREVVETATDAPCVFLQGASGELGPREGFVGDTSVADRNGRQLGYAALSILESLPAAGTRFEYAGPVVSGATIGTWEHRPVTDEQARRAEAWAVKSLTIPLPYRDDLQTAAQIKRALTRLEAQEQQHRDAGRDAEAADRRALAERKRRALARRKALPDGETFPYQAVVWRVGEAVWVGVQGEPYSRLQLELRNRFPHTRIIVASLGFAWSVGYLPPRETYGRGIYQESVAVVAPGSLETVIDTIAEQIQEVFSGRPSGATNR